MKTNAIIFLSLLTTLILGSCSTSNEVVGGGIFQKRKYNDGVYWNRNSNLKESSGKSEKGLDIFKDDEKSSASFYNNSNNEIITASNEETKENVSDVVNVDALEILVSEASNVTLIAETIESKKVISEMSQKKISGKLVDTKPAPVDDTAMLIILVILAILIPPLAVFIYEQATSRFWIDLILAILGFGVGFWLLGGLGWLCGLAAVIYALLIVLEVI